MTMVGLAQSGPVPMVDLAQGWPVQSGPGWPVRGWFLSRAKVSDLLFKTIISHVTPYGPQVFTQGFF